MSERIDWIIEQCDGEVESTSELYYLYDDYVKNFGLVSEETFKRYCRSARDFMEVEKDMQKETAQNKNEGTQLKSKKQTKDSLEIALTSYEINSIDELIKWADIDTDVWECTSQNVRSSGNISNPWFIVSGNFKKKNPSNISPEEYAERFKALINEYKPYADRVAPYHKNFPKNVDKVGKMSEICIMDFHFGQASWGDETREEDVTVESASELLDKTIDYFIEKTQDFTTQYVLPLGNDFFNTDTVFHTTTAGTFQDEHPHFKKTHMTAEYLLIKQIDKLADVAPVHVVCISGNHDEQRLWYLGEFLTAWYRSDPSVTIDNTPPQRKYYRWGQSLIGYTHGNKEVKGSLPITMAQEKPVWFAETKYREFHTGHLHGYSEKNTRVAKESFGIREIVLPSLVPLDQWHSGKGYRHLNEALCFVWDKDKGKTETYYFHP